MAQAVRHVVQTYRSQQLSLTLTPSHGTSSTDVLCAILQIKAGTWEGGHEKRATQYFEVMHQLTGSRIVKYFVMIIVIISLLCTGIAQIIAIATGMYYLKDTISKR